MHVFSQFRASIFSVVSLLSILFSCSLQAKYNKCATYFLLMLVGFNLVNNYTKLSLQKYTDTHIHKESAKKKTALQVSDVISENLDWPKVDILMNCLLSKYYECVCFLCMLVSIQFRFGTLNTATVALRIIKDDREKFHFQLFADEQWLLAFGTSKSYFELHRDI